jgi:large subunit ribosomal protein L10e
VAEMARRRWKCFKVLKIKGYQKKRSRSHRREFVRGGADPKITRFDIGNREQESWDVRIGLISDHNVNISHFALEAIRISANRRLTKYLGKDGFHMRIRKHPHDIYREKAMMSFAGADRLSAGMRNGFGKPIGRCARTWAGDVIIDCGCALKNVETVKKTFEVCASKLCTTSHLILLEANKPEYIAKVPLPYAKNFVGQ